MKHNQDYAIYMAECANCGKAVLIRRGAKICDSMFSCNCPFQMSVKGKFIPEGVLVVWDEV